MLAGRSSGVSVWFIQVPWGSGSPHGVCGTAFFWADRNAVVAPHASTNTMAESGRRLIGSPLKRILSRQNQLADVAARLHHPVRLGGRVKRERRMNWYSNGA